MHPNVHCSTIYNSQDMESISMWINRGMHKDDVVSIYKGTLAIKRKTKFVDVDGPRECHTEWSQSEREKHTLHMSAKWNLENSIDIIICTIEIEA